MQLLFRSEIPSFAWQFRDYIRKKYQIELILQQEKTDMRQNVIAVYLSGNSEQTAAILQDLAEFHRNPFDERYERASWETGDVSSGSHSLKELAENSSQGIKQQLLKTGPVTLLITLICIIVYGFEISGMAEQIMQFAHFPYEFGENQQIWRYFTHSLVHLSSMHITFNLVWWWIFGGAIERYFGSTKLIIIYVLAAFATGVTQNFASGPHFFGLSGVVYAVLGYVFVADKFSPNNRFNLPSGFFNVLIIGIALGFVTPLIGIKMGNTAHITGLLVGLILAFLQEKIGKKSK
ncbi:rhomboid family intramembrane serine protease [[Mannheimia] succiniciproducens]|uniref:GlpG protein n=1 Tax=Mannheimia succiniciproducens (strain KCTC 0769BP / MBEL55E) TaxID=221988 RepID=Q65QG8_MANSM|nr:rhomboid family intramembrane serine protease [[Mannheimia] succiniciproducens]AAU38792.1 GlpG protein [[Mannheimia] succiniciproducens MBEL55E]